MSLSIALGITKITKVKAHILLNFDGNQPKLVGTGKKLPKDSGKNISVKYLSKMWYLWSKNMKGMTDKVEILHRDQSDPTLQKTSKQLVTPFMVKYLRNIFIH